MHLRKFIVTGCLVSILAVANVAYANSIFPQEIIPTTTEIQNVDSSSITSDDVTDEEIKAQLYRAAQAVDAAEKEAFLQKFNAMSAQEKYDYLLPEYLNDLNMLYAQMKMMEEEILANRPMEEFTLDSFKYNVQDYRKNLNKFDTIGYPEFSTTSNLYNATNSIEYMIEKMQFIQLFVGSYNPDDIALKDRYIEEYHTHEKDYIDYYKTAFEFSLMREFGITIDDSVSRKTEESIRVHASNIEQFEQYMEDIIACGNSYSKGKADPDLFSLASHGKGAYLNLRNEKAMTLFGGEAPEHPELSPLGYTAAQKIAEAADKTSMFIYYYDRDNKEEKEAEMRQLQDEATEALNAFKKRCDELLPEADQIDKNILQIVADAKAEREKIAVQNGYNSWFEYQTAIEEEEKEAREAAIIDEATDLAVDQKQREEEARLRRQAAEEQRLRERVDFSKPLSQQTYNKQFYMQKSQDHLESVFGDTSGWVSLGLTMDSDAFDELFRIRANGGDIVTMQQLFDQNPFEFATILRLYKAYQ